MRCCGGLRYAALTFEILFLLTFEILFLLLTAKELHRGLQERVARLTMIKGHRDEAPAMFTRQIPGVKAGSFIPEQILRNVHHDKNQRENRVVTVLVYLRCAESGQEAPKPHNIYHACL